MPNFNDPSTNDFLNSSSSLRRLRITREFFDPTNKEHLKSLKNYMETGNWLQQFYPEAPFTDVPMTVFRKFAGLHLDVLVTEAQKDESESAAVIKVLQSKEQRESSQERTV